MRKRNLLFTLVLFGLLILPYVGNAVVTSISDLVAEGNKAITIPQTSGKTGYRLQVAETILGDRSGGATDRTGKSFTLSSWVNIDKFMNDSKNKGNVIMGHGPQVHMNYNGSLILSITETGELKVIAGASNKISKTLSTNITPNVWTYLTLIYNNDTQKVSAYMNGTLAGEEIQLSKQLELFGDDPCMFFVGGMGFSGLCDELQFFKKALSAAEVLQAYRTPENMPDLTAWYTFNSIDGSGEGSFLNKATVAGKATEEAVFFKYTGNTSSDPGLISGGVAQTAPTLTEGRAPLAVNYTVTLPAEVLNGTLTVMNAETPLIAGENQIEEGTVLTVTATPAEGYVLDHLKINGTSLTGNTFTVTEDAVITVAFTEEQAEAAPKAIHVPENVGNTKYQFRFDDIVLGEHTNGTNNNWDNGIVNKGDHRARNFTMSVWIKPLNATGELFGHAQAPFYGAQGTFGVSVDNKNQLLLKARAWINGGQCDGINALTASETLKTGEWAFLTVAVNDDARTIKLYKNGVLLVTGDLSKTGNGTESHGIGLLQDECVFFAGNGGASCDVDEVQIWNKTLTDNEVAASMEGYTAAPKNLVAHYKFDEESVANIPNRGVGVACNAGLVSGTTKYQGSPYWADVYTCSPIQATLVDGHILPKFVVSYVPETEHGSFVIKNGDNIITSGSKVAQFTTLTIETTPVAGYRLRTVKVNNVAIEGNSFILTEDATITVEFTDKLAVKYTVPENGTLEVTDIADQEHPLSSGDEFEKGKTIQIKITANEGYEIGSFTINGEEKKTQLSGGVYTLSNCQTNLDIHVEFIKKQFNIAFSSNSSGTLTVKKGNVAIENNTQVEYGTVLTIVVKSTGLTTLTAFTINGVDKLSEIKNTLQMNITVTEALDIKAEFSVPTWTVKCNITGEGSVKIEDKEGNEYENGVATIPHRAYVTLTFTPGTNHILDKLSSWGESLLEEVDNNKYELGYIDDDYTFDVTFAIPSSINNTSTESVSAWYKAGVLHVDGMKEGDKLDIYDITGNYVKTSAISETNVADLSDGCYLVRVFSANTIKTVKFIKR